MPTPGFVLGQNFWIGSLEGCKAVQKPIRLTFSNRFERSVNVDIWSAKAPFDIDYRMVYAVHRSPWQIQVEFVLDGTVCMHQYNYSNIPVDVQSQSINSLTKHGICANLL